MAEVERAAESLEPIVDKHGIACVLEALALVAELKADHIASNWGDRGLAAAWKRVAGKVAQTARVAAREKL